MSAEKASEAYKLTGDGRVAGAGVCYLAKLAFGADVGGRSPLETWDLVFLSILFPGTHKSSSSLNSPANHKPASRVLSLRNQMTTRFNALRALQHRKASINHSFKG